MAFMALLILSLIVLCLMQKNTVKTFGEGTVEVLQHFYGPFCCLHQTTILTYGTQPRFLFYRRASGDSDDQEKVMSQLSAVSEPPKLCCVGFIELFHIRSRRLLADETEAGEGGEKQKQPPQ